MKNVDTSRETFRGFMMCTKRRCRDEGVSPVVGVMLMLVVTIIIAAVVSAYAGGIGGNAKETPKLIVDMKLKNTGNGYSNYEFNVVSVSKPIPTKDIKIVTSWKTADGTRGGSTVAANLNVPNTNTNTGLTSRQYHSPLGFGQGITLQTQSYQKVASPFDLGQMFGNYTLVSGTTMRCSATSYGATTPYTYPAAGGTFVNDGIQAVFGNEWYKLRSGDTVNVKFVYVPNGQILVEKDVGVEG